MNATTWTIYREYLNRVNDPVAASNLTLADAMRSNAGGEQSVTSEPPVDRQLTVAEAATKLRVSRRIVYELCGSGLLPNYRVGHSIRIPESGLPRCEQVENLYERPLRKPRRRSPAA